MRSVETAQKIVAVALVAVFLLLLAIAGGQDKASETTTTSHPVSLEGR
jgi:hypothetical protein